MNLVIDSTATISGHWFPGPVTTIRSRALPVSPLVPISPGPARVLQSSRSLPWQGFLLEKHLCSPGERMAASIDRPAISLLCDHSARIEFINGAGCQGPRLHAPGTLTSSPAGRLPDVRLHTPAELIHCVFEASFLERVVAELNPKPQAQPVFRTELRDESIQRLLTLLFEELEADAPSAMLYVDSLAYALATRFLLLPSECDHRSDSRVSALPLRVLNRVRQKMEDGLHSDLSLNSLAEESGYSREHFLRMFRVATGLTPHQYILNLRLDRAQEWLRRKNASLIDIAAYCGFSSQSHMTSVFRKRLGMTPAEFRRSR